MPLKIHYYLNVYIFFYPANVQKASTVFLGKKELVEEIITCGNLGHSFKN